MSVPTYQPVQYTWCDVNEKMYLCLMGVCADCKLCTCAAEVFKVIKGHVPGLLKHPCGAAVVDELYSVASAQQRSALAAEFFGKEYSIFSSVRGHDKPTPVCSCSCSCCVP